MRRLKSENFDLLIKFIEEYREEYGNAPTFDEISRGTSLPKTTVARYLAHMREHNMINYDGHRSIVTGEGKSGKTVRVPVLGSVACGLPTLAEENIEEYVKLPESIFGNGNFFLLRANGESMVEAGIRDGDFVLVRQQNTAENGEIAVVLIENEATLKRFYKENGKFRLHPENSAMEDIYTDDCTVQGIAVKIIKDAI